MSVLVVPPQDPPSATAARTERSDWAKTSVPVPSVHQIALRRFPYPYRAMLAICSDLDETADREVYWEQMKFLNTRSMTAMGAGVGLEVGNSIYFDMPPGQFAYWNTDEKGRAMARSLMRSGHIDCLHSYGDLATTRQHAARALEELQRHNLSLKVWIDHAQAPTNFGADIMCGHGDESGHPAYHADLTLAHGVRYVWRGRVTSVIGQDRPLNVGGLWDGSQALTSTRTLAKELAKQALGRLGSAKYSFHARNQTLAPARLRDGQSTTEFLRCNPHPAGLDTGDTGDGLGDVLSRRFLDQLVGRGGVCILYTHLGKMRERHFSTHTVQALRLLAHYAEEQQIFVTTTRRLLDYLQFSRAVRWTVQSHDQGGVIHLSLLPPDDAASAGSAAMGLTLEVEGLRVSDVQIHGRSVPFVRHHCGYKDRSMISIPWQPLQFPDDV